MTDRKQILELAKECQVTKDIFQSGDGLVKFYQAAFDAGLEAAAKISDEERKSIFVGTGEWDVAFYIGDKIRELKGGKQ